MKKIIVILVFCLCLSAFCMSACSSKAPEQESGVADNTEVLTESNDSDTSAEVDGTFTETLAVDLPESDETTESSAEETIPPDIMESVENLGFQTDGNGDIILPPVFFD